MEIKQRLIEEEMKESYLDYSMSVIIGRALPDVRDGLKPVHRRILYSMYNMGLLSSKPFVKSARIVGECFKYHPHGDVPIYESLVRMAQNFSLRYPLVQGHGNFGTIDYPEPAQMRYTEARLSKIAEEMLTDIEKETIDFIPNFDGSLEEPSVLPSKIPNLLVNGSSGIAVGMATNIPPHNISEVINAIISQIDNPDITIEELMSFIKGPDFPTGASIVGKKGIVEAYKTGKGIIKIRAKCDIEELHDKKRIVIKEIPYQVNKSMLIEGIADLVSEKLIDGISDIKDESDKGGVRIILDLKKNAVPNIVLNQLYKNSQLESTFGIINIALVNNVPKILTLKEIISHYIDHRKEVITRKTKYEFTKAQERLHIVEGLQVALSNIDVLIQKIKQSKDIAQARNLLISGFSLTETQANAILDMKLHKLTTLEIEKINEERTYLTSLINELSEILSSEQRILKIIKDDLNDLRKFCDKRKTEILEQEEQFVEGELIPDEAIVITLTKGGYIKRTKLNDYRLQKRGGKGIIAMETKEEDAIQQILSASTKNTLLLFTNKGRVYWVKAYEIPEAERYSKGKSIANLVTFKENEKISTIIPVSFFSEHTYLIMATKKGMLKKTVLSAYSNPRKDGIIAISLREGDELITAALATEGLEFILASKNGLAAKISERQIREVGRNSIGVIGMRLREDDAIIGMETIAPDSSILTITKNGFGKRTKNSEYKLTGRGSRGIINIRLLEGDFVIGIKSVKPNQEIMAITSKGITIRFSVDDTPEIGRNTKGVKVIKIGNNDYVAGFVVVGDRISN